MFRNYVKIALRNLRKHPGYALINVFGLALGIACCLLILLFVRHELSYDRFNEQAEDTYRLTIDAFSGDRTFSYPSIGGGWGEALAREFPAVEHVARFVSAGQAWLLKEGERFEEERFLWADPEVFDVFTFPFIEGDATNALAEPGTLVLTRSAAVKYFGSPDAAVGRTLGFDFGNEVADLEVRGVIEDVPDNSHFHFDLLAPIETFRRQFPDNPQTAAFLDGFGATTHYTYFTVRDGYDVAEMEPQLSAFFDKYIGDNRTFYKAIHIQPLTDIHLKSQLLNEFEANGSIAYVYIFAAIALLTLLIACVNFMNLATARSAGRAKEVGLRKVAGASRKHLVRQFLGESLLLALLGLVVAVILAELALPAFNDLAGTSLDLRYDSLPVLGGLLGVAVMVGLVAGSYPAFFLSSFQPAAVLKGTLPAGARHAGIRRVLVIGQFAISILLLAGTAIVYQQLDFVRHGDLGFARDQRMVVPLPQTDNAERLRAVDVLRREFEQHPGVLDVTAASSYPGQLRAITWARTPEMPEDELHPMATLGVDHDYLDVMDIQLVDGRDFDPALQSDSTETFVVNETAARMLGIERAGDRFQWHSNRTAEAEVIQATAIGIIRDLHYEPLYREVNPMILRINPQGYINLIAEVDPAQQQEALAHMEARWREVAEGWPFAYTFLDGELEEIYQAEQKLSVVVEYFTLLALFIACLGLLGLASFTAEQRTKEIGVRKVLGATVPSIVLLVSKEFTGLVGIAFVFGAPLAYLVGRQWLGNFAYSAGIDWWIFPLAGLAALAVAWLTVSYHALRAALTDPVKALRYE